MQFLFNSTMPFLISKEDPQIIDSNAERGELLSEMPWNLYVLFSSWNQGCFNTLKVVIKIFML